jgi:hypothetical protein
VIVSRALVYWLEDMDRRGFDPVADLFDEDKLDRMISLQSIEAENPTSEKGDSTVKVPDKFNPENMHGWSIFNRQVDNYLQNALEVRKVPLIYVIRKDPPP